jgi:hypothetical protein
MEGEQGNDGNLALNNNDNKEALLKLIRKGAPSVAPEEKPDRQANERVQYPLRITSGVLERATSAAAGRDVRTPLNTWITEAILVQLKKEGF